MKSEERAALEAIARQLEYCGDELGKWGYLSCELVVSTALSLLCTHLVLDSEELMEQDGKTYQFRLRDPM